MTPFGNTQRSGQDMKNIRRVIFVRKYISPEEQRSHSIAIES